MRLFGIYLGALYVGREAGLAYKLRPSIISTIEPTSGSWWRCGITAMLILGSIA